MKGQVLEYQRPGYKMLASSNCYIFVFDEMPALDERAITLGDGSTLRPGDKLLELSGKHGSAGFTRLAPIDGHLIYSGLYSTGEDELALFRYSNSDDRRLFYGGHACFIGDFSIIYSTPARSSRVIETTIVKRLAA